ncbi:UvrD-helicase domain-containing protein [Streptomyces zhihengii]
MRRAVLEHARDAWQDKINPASRALHFHHDDYLKIWALSRPRIHADTVIFDEAQDINPVLRKVVLDNMRPTSGPPAQVVIVGDPNQSIYAFRGAENALEDWPADIELPLNKSWRFGPEVADIANIFLKLLRAPYLMEGNDGTSTAIGPIATPEAVLGRSNAGVVSAVLAALEEGRTVHMVGGGDELKRMAEGAKELQEKGRTRKHPELVPFRSWKQVRQYVDKHDSAKQLEVFVRLVDEHGADTLIEMVGQLTEDATDADLIVATAHKSKGLEWGLVQVGTDFRGPKASLEPGQPTVLPSDEELRLAYVTATRGMRELDLGSLAYVEELRALADEVYAARTGVAPQPATTQAPAAPTLVATPAPASDAGAPTGAPPAPGAFQVLKAVEAQKLATADGTLWWGGRGAGREKALKKPILVRIEIGQRGVVDVKDADTGTHVTSMRTGTPFFAAPATSGPPQNSGAPHEAQAPASSPAAEQPGGESATVSAPAAPVFKVEARPEVGGRRWAVLDAATREVVWVHKDGQALECAYDVRADAENMRDALALAPELRVDAPTSARPQPGIVAAERFSLPLSARSPPRWSTTTASGSRSSCATAPSGSSRCGTPPEPTSWRPARACTSPEPWVSRPPSTGASRRLSKAAQSRARTPPTRACAARQRPATSLRPQQAARPPLPRRRRSRQPKHSTCRLSYWPGSASSPTPSAPPGGPPSTSSPSQTAASKFCYAPGNGTRSP